MGTVEGGSVTIQSTCPHLTKTLEQSSILQLGDMLWPWHITSGTKCPFKDESQVQAPDRASFLLHEGFFREPQGRLSLYKVPAGPSVSSGGSSSGSG